MSSVQSNEHQNEHLKGKNMLCTPKRGKRETENLITATSGLHRRSSLLKTGIGLAVELDSRKTSQGGFQLPLPINSFPSLGLWITKTPYASIASLPTI